MDIDDKIWMSVGHCLREKFENDLWGVVEDFTEESIFNMFIRLTDTTPMFSVETILQNFLDDYRVKRILTL